MYLKYLLSIIFSCFATVRAQNDTLLPYEAIDTFIKNLAYKHFGLRFSTEQSNSEFKTDLIKDPEEIPDNEVTLQNLTVPANGKISWANLTQSGHSQLNDKFHQFRSPFLYKISRHQTLKVINFEGIINSSLRFQNNETFVHRDKMKVSLYDFSVVYEATVILYPKFQLTEFYFDLKFEADLSGVDCEYNGKPILLPAMAKILNNATKAYWDSRNKARFNAIMKCGINSLIQDCTKDNWQTCIKPERVWDSECIRKYTQPQKIHVANSTNTANPLRNVYPSALEFILLMTSTIRYIAFVSTYYN